MGVGSHVVHAFRQLVGVYLPVAEAGVVAVARIVLREPAVIEHEHLQAHPRGIVDHPQEGLRGKGEIGALPAVEERGMDLPAVVDAVVAGPAVQVAGGLSRAGGGEGPDHVGRDEGLAGGQRIGRGEGADAGDDVEPAGVVAVEGQAEVAAPGQGAGDYVARRLAEFGGAEAEQEGRIAALRGLDAAPRLDHLGVVSQQLAVRLHFAGPAAPGVGEQVLVGFQVEGGRSVVQQFHRALAAVGDLRVGHDHVFVRVGVIDQRNGQGGHGVLQPDGRRDDVAAGRRFMAGVEEFGIVVAVGIADVQGRCAEEGAADGGDRHRSFARGEPPDVFHRGELPGIEDAGAIMAGAEVSLRIDGEDELGMVGFDDNRAPLCGGEVQGAQDGAGKQE